MKKAVIAVAIVLLGLGGLVFLLPMAVNSTALRAALASQLSHASGAEITLNGAIHFSVLPDFGVVVEDFAYRSEDGALEVTSERSVASVALLSLFSGQLQITGIELRSPRMVLGAAKAPAAEPQPASADTDDIFRAIAGYLENVSFDQITVTDGEVSMRQDGNAAPIASDIDMRLSIPGISAPASLAVSATVDGNRMELGAELGSLRDLLSRQPARFSLSAKASQPLHPALADIAASGSIQLADDGSYRISGGEIDSIGHKMHLDAGYTPGETPFVVVRIKAGALSYADFVPDATDAPAAPTTPGTVDLSALKSLDADIEIYAQSIAVGEATARDVVISTRLEDGKLLSTLDSTDIAGGSLLASMALDANVVPSVASGSLNLTSIDIDRLLALAGQAAPLSGTLSSELQYAFKGLDIEAIRNSLNLRGTVSIAQGRVAVPQLTAFAGQNAGVVDALTATVGIEDTLKPMVVTGSARWNGEGVNFSSSLTPTDLLWGQASAVAIDLKSQPVDASFNGTLSPSGEVSGKADITTPSLTRALAWLGQSSGTPLGRFAFSGGVSANASQFGVNDARIQLDDIAANGAISIALSGKPRITADLSVDTLDFGALTGSGGMSQTAAAGPAPIDLSMLRLFNADIRLAANQLGYGKVRMGPTSAALTVAEGVAKLSVPNAGFYNGAVSVNITADGAGSVPKIDIIAGMEGVDALPLFTDAAGFDRIEGKLKASVQVAGAGANSEAFARSLNGPASVVATDGAIRGIDVAGLVRNVRSLIGSGYSQDANARTEFSELSIPVTIVNGVAQASDIRVLGPFARMSGAGSVDLGDQTIDMRLDPRVVGSLDGQGGDFDVSGLGMPIMITGPLAGPRIYPDLSSILADPNRALAVIAELGGGLGGLADEAATALGGLDNVLNTDPSSLAEGAVTDLIGQFAGGQAQPNTEGQPSGGALLNGLGGMLGQQPQGADTAQPAPSIQTNQLIDLFAPPLGTETDDSGDDPLGGLLNQLGM